MLLLWFLFRTSDTISKTTKWFEILASLKLCLGNIIFINENITLSGACFGTCPGRFFSEQVIEKDDVAARHLNYCLVTIYQELLGFKGRLIAILANELAS